MYGGRAPKGELGRSSLFYFTPFDVELNVWGGGQGGLNLPLPVPFNPGSRPVFFGSRPFAFFRLQNIAQCCVIFPFSPASRHLGNPASRPLFSHLPYTSRPLFSRSPAPLFPPLMFWSFRLHTCYGDAVSKHVWSLKDQNIKFDIVKWREVKQARSYSNVTKKCSLCLWEKYFTNFKPEI